MTDDISLMDTLKHIADDHPCCAVALLYVVARIKELDNCACYGNMLAEKNARIAELERLLLPHYDGDWSEMDAALAAGEEKP